MPVVRRILATSGGFVPAPVHNEALLGGTVLRGLELTGKQRPRVCLMETASGDDASWYAALFSAFNEAGCDVTQLRLFTQPSADPEERLCSSDLVWVGGGSVANLLAVWAVHGVGDAMRAAWERGVILAGVSAGSVCWHVGGTTDSFGATLRPVTNGLGLVPYGNGVHYDVELQRRPLLHQLVADGTLPEVAYATDNGVGILYEGEDPVEVVVDVEDSGAARAAYRVEKAGDGVVETCLAPGAITS